MSTMVSVAKNGEISPVNGNIEESPSTPLDVNIAMKCVLKSDTTRFIKCFEDEEDPFKENVTELMDERDDQGKTPLDMAAILARNEMLKELILRGADVNKISSTGYSSLHHAAAWGKIDCLKVLIEEGGADLQLRTNNNERARETAFRYNNAECVDYLDWAEAKQTLVTAITTMKETVADQEKVQGRLTRDDKNLAVNICNEKSEWIESTAEATTQDFITQKAQLDEVLSVIWIKLSEPLHRKNPKRNNTSMAFRTHTSMARR